MKKEKIKKHKLLLRHLTAEDYPQLAEMMDRVYDNLGGAWQKDQYISQVTRFPEGQIGIEDNGMLVAAAFSMIVDYAKFGDNHTHNQITGNGYLTHHTLEGDTLYGVDIFVHPSLEGCDWGGVYMMPVKKYVAILTCGASLPVAAYRAMPNMQTV